MANMTHDELKEKFPELRPTVIEIDNLLSEFVEKITKLNTLNIIEKIEIDIFNKKIKVGYNMDWKFEE